ncbi:ATP binding, partial [Kickxella alabastrina]
MNSSTAQQFSNTAAGQHTEPESQSQPPPQPEDSQSTRLTLQQVNQWSESRVCKWVREQGFTKYEASFRENMINGEALVELDYNLLKDLSVRTVGERVRLNLAIKRLRQQCLQVEADNEATARGKQSMAAEGYASPNSLTPHSGIDISPVSVSALRNSHSAAASAAGTVNANGALMNCGAKDLPQPLRIAHSSAAIGGPASSENGANHNNGSSIIQRANTDTRSFSTREHINNQHHPSQTIGGVALRRPKTPHDKASNLVQPLTMSPLVSMNMLKQGSKTGSAKENGHLSQSSKLSLKTNPGALSGMLGVEPMSAPLPRMRMISNTFRQLSTSASPPPSTPLQALRDAVESKSSSKYGSGEDADRLGLQFQEFFGTEINVANLADSLTVKTWQVTISGPDNQVHQVTISMGSSAATILDKVRDEFDLNNDSDGEQYSLFSMTSEGGGARCLSNDELTKLFADPEGSPPQKFFLRKRHQLSRPLMNSNRSEHLQRAIERLGNTLPASQQQQTQRAASKWDNTTEKLTKILGERPPSELVSMNVEKYFPGNEARARHSIMRRKRH